MTETSGNLALKKETASKLALPAIRTRFSSVGNARCIVVLRQKRRFNSINLHLYHYAGNNPVRYVDPDGRTDCGVVTNKVLESSSQTFAREGYTVDLDTSNTMYYTDMGYKYQNIVSSMATFRFDDSKQGQKCCR